MSKCAIAFDIMVSKGLRLITCKGKRKMEAGFNPLPTDETLIGYTACYAVVHYFNRFIMVDLKS